MNIEDGDELPIRVTFEDEGGDLYWHYRMAVVPHVGDTVIIGAAPKGIRHVARRIDHHVGGASHRIVVVVARVA